MTEYIVSDPVTLERLFKCFGTTEDFFVFLEDMHDMSEAVNIVIQGLKDHKDNEEAQAIVVGSYLIQSALFFRRNIDTIKDIVNVANFEVVDEKSKEAYMSRGDTLDMTDRLKKFEPDVKTWNHHSLRVRTPGLSN